MDLGNNTARNRFDRRCIAARCKEAALILSAVGYDVSVHLVEKHSVRRGSGAPSLEMGSKAWIVLIKELRLDHFFDSIRAPLSMLEWTSTTVVVTGQRKNKHHEERSVSSSRFCEECDLPSAQVLEH